MEDKEFIVNKNITLKLEESRTNIYVSGEKFIQCKFLLLEIPVKDVVVLDELKSIDEFSEQFGNPFNIHTSQFPIIPPEVEFWGHCSNLQVWFENNYNTNLLHSNIAFPLLKHLTQVGDIKARRIFKDEIAKRIESGYVPTIIYLIVSNFLDVFTQSEFEALIEAVKENDYILEEGTLGLIWFFKSKYLSVNDLIFLIEHPRINFFELLIKYGKIFFDKDGDYIGKFRQWITDFLGKLVKWKPKYLADKINELIVEDIINVKEYEIFNKKLGINETKIDYSSMDEFSILLYNRLHYSLMKYNV